MLRGAFPDPERTLRHLLNSDPDVFIRVSDSSDIPLIRSIPIRHLAIYYLVQFLERPSRITGLRDRLIDTQCLTDLSRAILHSIHELDNVVDLIRRQGVDDAEPVRDRVLNWVQAAVHTSDALDE